MTISDIKAFIDSELGLEETTEVNMEIEHDKRIKTHRVTAYNINRIELRKIKTDSETRKIICLIHTEEIKK